MKNNIVISLWIAILFLNASCIDGVMVDRTSKDNYYKTEQHIQNALAGAYSYLNDFSYHKTNWTLAMLGFEDAMFVTSIGVPNSISTNMFTSNTPPVINLWGVLYKGINAVNELLYAIPDVTFSSEAKRSKVMAEAHFLRALYYYDLVRVYGGVNGVPLKLVPTSVLGDAYVPGSPREAVYEQIVSDFEYAAGLNEDGTDRLPVSALPGKASQSAAHAFLAEVHLTLRDWEKAVLYADKVIATGKYSLLDNYADLWNVEKEADAYKEHIFAIPFFNDADAPEDSSLGSNAAFFYCPAGVAFDGSNLCGNPFGKGQGGFQVQKWFIKYFQNDEGGLGYSDPAKDASTDLNISNLAYKDYRIETSFFRKYKAKVNATGVMTNKTAYPASGEGQDNWGFVKKYIDPNGLGNRTNGNDIPRLRLSDMYLIKAEACNELGGNYSEACKAIDKVRERARKADGMERSWPKYIGTDKADNIGRTLSQDEFRWLVFMERGLEFVGEHKRWFDLIRMKYDTHTLMYDYMMNTFIPSRLAADVNKVCVMAERKKLWPVPYNEVLRNSGVKQNPGY